MNHGVPGHGAPESPQGTPGFPVFKGRAETSRTAAGTSHTINLPTTENGDLIILLVAATAGAWTNTAGFTDLGLQLGILTKIADGTEGSTVVLTRTTSSRIAAHALVFSNARESIEVAVTNGSNSINPPNLSAVSWGAANNMWVAAVINSGSSFSITAAPSLFTNFDAEIYNSGGVSLGVASATYTTTTVGMDPSAFTGGENGYTRAATIGIQAVY